TPSQLFGICPLAISSTPFWARFQDIGFIVLTGLFLILGLSYQYIKQYMPMFFTIFSFCQLFQNFGPNATTFVIPSEVFPTIYRSTGYGISDAFGKLGNFGFFQLKILVVRTILWIV
ncbi:12493_t:CDS:2, partial [Dentiscutata heterogama]